MRVVERTEGAVGAIIRGIVGIAVEKVLKSAGTDANLDVAAAEFTSLVRSTQRTGRDMGLGALAELVVSLEHINLVMRLFNKDYFVVLGLQPGGHLGRGKFELRKAELELAHEFTV